MGWMRSLVFITCLFVSQIWAGGVADKSKDINKGVFKPDSAYQACLSAFEISQGAVGRPGTKAAFLPCEFKVMAYDSILYRQHEKYGFNGAILVAENGKIMYQHAVGSADFEKKIPLQVNSVFQLGSVTKQFTAMGILMLAERGKLRLDDRAWKYLPGFPYWTITIRQLLQHTSGLPEYVNGNAFDKYLVGENLNNDALIYDMWSHKMPLQFVPGTKHIYSNTGYAMLGRIIEKVSGESYDEFMELNIFHPLGMNNTYCYEELADCSDSLLVKIPWVNKSKSARLNHIVGDKGIYSTVQDLFLWDQALYTEKLLSQKWLNTAFASGRTLYGMEFNYGFGWRICKTTEGKKVTMHCGLWEGFNTAIIRYVGDGRTIIMLSNMVTPYCGTLLLRPMEKVLYQKDEIYLAMAAKNQLSDKVKVMK